MSYRSVASLPVDLSALLLPVPVRRRLRRVVSAAGRRFVVPPVIVVIAWFRGGVRRRWLKLTQLMVIVVGAVVLVDAVVVASCVVVVGVVAVPEVFPIVFAAIFVTGPNRFFRRLLRSCKIESEPRERRQGQELITFR